LMPLEAASVIGAIGGITELAKNAMDKQKQKGSAAQGETGDRSRGYPGV